MRVIIAGGRDFNDYERLKRVCDEQLQFFDDIEIVSGCARGADTLGIQYAVEKGYPIKKFPADWQTHGRFAGPLRNTQMAEYADMLIAFWDGSSRGTADMIKKAHQHLIHVHVFQYFNP